MSKLDFFRPRSQKSKKRVARRSVGTRRLGSYGRSPRLEALEERALLAITVSPSNLNGWAIANFDNAGVGGTVTDFVLGPATPPAGVGSLHQHVGPDGNDASRLRTAQFAGTLLSNISTLSYNTYVTTPGGQASYIILNVDNDNNGTTDEQLFFEPVYQSGIYSTVPGASPTPQGSLAPNTWQQWNVATGGVWAASGPGGPPLDTLSHYAATHPGAKLANGNSLQIVAGFGAPDWNNFSGNVDLLTFNATQFNFEPNAANTVYVDDNWVGTPQGADPDGAGPATSFGYDAFDTIQGGVDGVATSGTVHVAAGTYPEFVQVNKTVSLLGAQAGVDGRTISRTGLATTESVVRGSQTGATRSTSFNVLANDVIIDGFTVQEATNPNLLGSEIRIGSGTAGTEIRNNILQDGLIGVQLANNSAVNQTIIEKNLFRNNNNVVGGGGGNAIYSDQFVAGGPVTNVLVDNNTFTNNPNASLLLDFTGSSAANIIFSNNLADSQVGLFATSSATITGNTISSPPSSGSGVLIGGGDSNILIGNNTIGSVGTGTAGIRIGDFIGSSPNSAVQIQGNIINPVASAYGIRLTSGGYTGALTILNTSVNGASQAVEFDGFSTLNLNNFISSGNTSGGTLANISTVNVSTTGLADTVNIGNNTLSTNAMQQVTYSGVTTINADGLAGNDTFNVSPSLTAKININGNSPTFGDPGVPPGDTLNFSPPPGQTFTISGGNTINTTGGYQQVTFVGIENMPISPLGTGTSRYDFNTPTSPTQSGYTAVLPTTVYVATAGLDFGWSSSVSAFDRGPLVGSASDLLRDGHYGASGAPGARTFRTDVATVGYYLVSVTIGDKSFARDNIQVSAEGNVVFSNVTTTAGQFKQQSFVVNVTDGTLDLQFSDTGGDPYWVVNSVEVRPAVMQTLGIVPPGGTLPADNTTVDTFNGYNATPNALITVATTLGAIVSPDADPNYAGIQVQANGTGNFTILIRRPGIGGTATVTAEETTGAQNGATQQQYSGAGLKFDFNTASSPTAAGYTGVLPGDTYTAARGYGWVTGVNSFDRGSPDALRRDGHYGITGAGGARTFSVDVPNGTYNITVTIGDQSFARDNIQVNAEGGAAELTGVNTTAGTFTTQTFSIVVSDGQLNVQFSDTGGDPYWVVNGLEVASAGPLLAATIVANSSAPKLTSAELSSVVSAAIDLWAATGISAADVARLKAASVSISNLDAVGALGMSSTGRILIDDNGGGSGYFVDATPKDNSEFTLASGQLTAKAGSAAASRVDLLTVVLHELGHQLGHDDVHSDSHDVMADTLGVGIRHIPAGAHDDVFAGWDLA